MITPHKNEIKICLVCAIVFCIFIGICMSCDVKAASPFIETEGLSINQFIDPYTENYVLLERQEIAHVMAECARRLGYTEDNEVILIAKNEWHSCEEKILANNLEC